MNTHLPRILRTLFAALLIFVFTIPSQNQCSSSKVLASSILSTPITDWQIYNDVDHGFAIEFPIGWEYKITLNQEIPYPDPFAIIRRVTFVGREGLIDLDIWLANGRNFTDWLIWYGQTRNPLPTMELNAIVGGYPALAFLEKGSIGYMLTTFFNDGKYIYRFWYSISRNEAGFQAYAHMLDTFLISNGKPITAKFPESIEQRARQAIVNSSIVNPLVSSCCGYYSLNNPFPCCTRGNCTWWVYYKYSGVPFHGDAGDWWGQVPDYYGWGRGSCPLSYHDNIAWWSRDQKPPWGHVAYTAYYTGGASITISEMLCDSPTVNCMRTRTISVTSTGGYIYYWNY